MRTKVQRDLNKSMKPMKKSRNQLLWVPLSIPALLQLQASLTVKKEVRNMLLKDLPALLLTQESQEITPLLLLLLQSLMRLPKKKNSRKKLLCLKRAEKKSSFSSVQNPTHYL